MGIVIAVICIVVVIFCFFILIKQREAQQKSNEATEQLIKKEDFQISKTVQLLDGKELYLDDINKKWLLKTSRIDTRPKIYSYDDLLEFEITQDGGSIAKGVTKGKTSGKTGRAIIGGVLFGPIGAIVGASGKKTSKSTTVTKTVETCTSLQVHIRVADINQPEITFSFIHSEVPVTSSLYTNALYLARNLAATLAYIQSGKSIEVIEKQVEAHSDSPSDELKNFFDLKEAGIITEEEFEAKKKQLLGL